MASSFIASANLAVQEITIYFGISTFVMGVIGGCLNVIIFLSLKTFRQSSCAFYLTIMSIFDIGRLFSSVLTFIMRWGFKIDWGISSLFFCKLRLCIFSISTLNSMTCLCLATIDQYLATSSRLRWQQWCNIKLAHRITPIFIIIWTLQGIPYLIFNNHIISPLKNTTVCQTTNYIFNQYLIYGYYLTLNNILPLITIVFGIMAYYNARHLAHRIVPLIRRELDKQLTVMVLVQVLISFCTILPFSINTIFQIVNTFPSDPVIQAKLNLAGIIITNYFILNIAVRVLSIIFYFHEILLEISQFSSRFYLRDVENVL
jgi:hypothetical protein